MILRIVVPLDGSRLAEQVLPLTASITKDMGLKMTLLRVTPAAVDYYGFIDYPLANYDDLAREMNEEAVEYLNQMGRKLRMEGVSPIEERLMHGRAETAIADYAREVPHCLVAMTTHGRSGIGRWLLGSVANRVIRQSGAPVLVIRSREQQK
jgi:nucleotide-binding universal stress UspA family protein